MFQRSVRVIVDNLQVSGLRVQFKIKKTLKKDPNTAEIIITNLNEDSRAQMKKKGARVILLAGYGNVLQQVFQGDARRINHEHKRPDWETKIQCGDGEESLLNARCSESFKPGANWKDVVKKVAKQLVTDRGNLDAATAQISDAFLNGYTAHGRAANELDKLFKGRGLDWSIQDGRLQVLGLSEVNSDSVTVLKPDTGLVGSPEFGTAQKNKGPEVLRARSLLQPQLRPGARIRVESEAVKGYFKLIEAVHTGDTASQPWYSDVEGIAI